MESFKFLIAKDPDTNLIFISSDSLAGYIKALVVRLEDMNLIDDKMMFILDSLAYMMENIEDFPA